MTRSTLKTFQINAVFLVLALVALGRSKKQKAKTTNKDKSTEQAM